MQKPNRFQTPSLFSHARTITVKEGVTKSTCESGLRPLFPCGPSIPAPPLFFSGWGCLKVELGAFAANIFYSRCLTFPCLVITWERIGNGTGK